MYLELTWGFLGRSWLRQCATRREFMGSISDGGPWRGLLI